MNLQVVSLFLVDIPAEMLANGAEELGNVYGSLSSTEGSLCCGEVHYKKIQQCREHIKTDLSMPTR